MPLERLVACGCSNAMRSKRSLRSDLKNPKPDKNTAPHTGNLAATRRGAREEKTNVEMSLPPETTRSQQRLRAMVEIVSGELKIFPIADTDEQADEIVRRVLGVIREGL
jgi:hypothetical protein